MLERSNITGEKRSQLTCWRTVGVSDEVLYHQVTVLRPFKF
jgi:hypothetical protein